MSHMSRTNSAMETQQLRSIPLRESQLQNRVAHCELSYSGLFNACSMEGLAGGSPGCFLVECFQFGPTFAPIELVTTMSALCDIGVEISGLRSQHGVRCHTVNDCSGRISYNRQESSATREPLHDSDTRMTIRSWNADPGFCGYPLARSGGVAAA